MKKRCNYGEDLLKECYDIIDVFYKQGKSDAECRYHEIMAELLALILGGIERIRTVAFFLLGTCLGLLISRLLCSIFGG